MVNTMKKFINLLAMNWTKANIEEFRAAYIAAHVDAGYWPDEIQDLAQNFKFYVDGRHHLVIERVRVPSPEQVDVALRRRALLKPSPDMLEIYQLGFTMDWGRRPGDYSYWTRDGRWRRRKEPLYDPF